MRRTDQPSEFSIWIILILMCGALWEKNHNQTFGSVAPRCVVKEKRNPTQMEPRLYYSLYFRCELFDRSFGPDPNGATSYYSVSYCSLQGRTFRPILKSRSKRNHFFVTCRTTGANFTTDPVAQRQLEPLLYYSLYCRDEFFHRFHGPDPNLFTFEK